MDFARLKVPKMYPHLRLCVLYGLFVGTFRGIRAELLSESPDDTSYETVTPFESVRVRLSVQLSQLTALGVNHTALHVPLFIRAQYLLQTRRIAYSSEADPEKLLSLIPH